MRSRTRVALGLMAGLVIVGCHRKIDEEPEVELIEHRIEPCTVVCTAAYDPQCGAEELPPRTVEECIEACATPGGSQWAYQEDGTDACAEEWFRWANCIEALDCDGRHAAFNEVATPDRACGEEALDKADCYYTTPSLDREDPPP